MSTRICLDLGFSAVKIAKLTDGVLTYFKEQNAVYNLGKDNLDAYSGNEKNIVEFNGSHYLIGRSALQMDNSGIQKVTDYESMRTISPIVAKKYLKGFDPADIEYVCFTLSSAYLDKSQDYHDYIATCLPEYQDKIKLIPQGAGIKKAIDAIGLDIDNPSHKDSYKNYILVDIGSNTNDVCRVIDGSLMPNDIKGYEHTGAVLIAEEVQKQVKAKFNIDLALPKAKAVLEDKTFKVRADTYDCTEIVQKATELYLGVLKDFLEQHYKEDMDSISNVILFGGGACIIAENAKQWEDYYGKGFMVFPKVAGSATFYNAIGGCYL